MTLIGVDLNATRARAVYGPSHSFPLPLKLEEEQRDLPLAVSLAERKPVVGRPGLALCRSQPHLTALDFLAHLGEPRQWSAGRHRLDSTALLGLVLDRLNRSLVRPEGVAMAVPAYLLDAQLTQINQLADKVQLPLLTTLPSPLAAARWAFQRHPWNGIGLVGDVDGASFTWSAVVAEGTQARLLEVQSFPRLNRNAWLMRLLDGVAGRCIRLSRRDPRQVPETEQLLFDRLSGLLEAPVGSRLVEMSLRTSQWSQHLLVQPAELSGCCAALIRQTTEAMRECSMALPAHAPVRMVLLTASAGSLPGLLPAVESAFNRGWVGAGCPHPDRGARSILARGFSRKGGWKEARSRCWRRMPLPPGLTTWPDKCCAAS